MHIPNALALGEACMPTPKALASGETCMPTLKAITSGEACMPTPQALALGEALTHTPKWCSYTHTPQTVHTHPKLALRAETRAGWWRAPPELPSRAIACDTALRTNAWQSASLMLARQCLSQKP